MRLSIKGMETIRNALICVILTLMLTTTFFYFFSPILFYVIYFGFFSIGISLIIYLSLKIYRKKKGKTQKIKKPSIPKPHLKVTSRPQQKLAKQDGRYLEYYYQANQLGQMGRLSEALQYFDKSIELNPQFHKAWSYKGITLTHLKKFEAALECFDMALKLKPNNSEFWSDKATALRELERHNEAIKTAEKAIELHPYNFRAYIEKGLSQIGLGKYDEGISNLEKSLEINPSNKDGKSFLNDAKNNIEKLQLLNQKLAENPNDANILKEKGLTLEKLYNCKDALTFYNKSLEIEPNLVETWQRKEYIYFTQKMYSDVVNCANKIIELDPKNVDEYERKAFALYKLNQYEEAVSCINDALKINPHSKTALEMKNLLIKSGLEAKEIKVSTKSFEPPSKEKIIEWASLIEFEYEDDYYTTFPVILDYEDQEKHTHIKKKHEIVIDEDEIKLTFIYRKSGKMGSEGSYTCRKHGGFTRIDLFGCIYRWAVKNFNRDKLSSIQIYNISCTQYPERNNVSVLLKDRFAFF